MKCEVMVSTMNRKEKHEIIDLLNIKDCVIINQNTKDIVTQDDDNDSSQKFLTFKESGLSKSRNKAIMNCTADICIVADDDMQYVDNYDEIIINGYKKHPQADIIAFWVERENKKIHKKNFNEGRIGYLKSMKISSVHITFKRNSILNNNIKFDEKFGAGSDYPWGEENIFLFDCLKKGLKIYYVPEKIAVLKYTGTSTWDRSINEERFKNQGRIFYRMEKNFYWILILQYALRKRHLYKGKYKFSEVIRYMFDGVKEYKEKEV